MDVIYVCKTCGRAIATDTRPSYCYFDLLDTIENISDSDSKKMGLFGNLNDSIISEVRDNDAHIVFEFPDDVRYDPFSGSALYLDTHEVTQFDKLHSFQLSILDDAVKKSNAR